MLAARRAGFALGVLVGSSAGLLHSAQRDAGSLEPAPEFEVVIDADDALESAPAHDHPAPADASRSMLFWANSTFCLNFLHIPKTAGTTIESVRLNGDTKPARWGSHDHELNCKGMTTCGDKEPFLGASRCCPMKDGSKCPVWHVPPVADEMLSSSYRHRHCETFCVVREPAARFRSQYAWSAPWQGVREPCTTEALHKAVDEKLESLKKTPYQESCHFVPQTEYWQEGRTCQHVIKQENLHEEFTALMTSFGLTATFKQKHKLETHCKAEFDSESLHKLQKYYADDYRAFGYPLA